MSSRDHAHAVSGGAGTPAPPITKVPCPRCHEPCGWCSDYRHMHRLLKLPGSKRRCGIKDFEPEGDDCPVCHGVMQVYRLVVYTPIPPGDGASTRGGG